MSGLGSRLESGICRLFYATGAGTLINKNFLLQGNLAIPGTKALPDSSKQLPCTFVGDEAFPLKCYMMRPYPGRQLTPTRRIFNYRLSRARRVIEMRLE
jgi:hypothetical protein